MNIVVNLYNVRLEPTPAFSPSGNMDTIYSLKVIFKAKKTLISRLNEIRLAKIFPSACQYLEIGSLMVEDWPHSHS